MGGNTVPGFSSGEIRVDGPLAPKPWTLKDDFLVEQDRSPYLDLSPSP